MSILRTCLIGLMAGAMMCDPVMFIKPANAQAPSYFFDSHRTRLPHGDCIRDAQRTARELRMDVRTNVDFAVGGFVGNSAVLMICTFIPRAGPCPGQDGAVVTMYVSGPSSAESSDTLRRVQSSFGNATVIDCG